MIPKNAPKPWRVEIQHGPEGEQNYAWVYDGKEMIGTFKTHRANQIVDAMNRRPEPSAPSPAGVKVDGMLSNLLARIHRDGGHYEAEHGIEKAVADADLLIANLYVERDEAAASLDQATRRAEEAEARSLDSSILAHAWMEAHDKRAAGKPYSFPSPADKPALLVRAEAAEARCTALEQALEPFALSADFHCWGNRSDDAVTESLHAAGTKSVLTVGDFRRAREARSSTASSITEKETDRENL